MNCVRKGGGAILKEEEEKENVSNFREENP